MSQCGWLLLSFAFLAAGCNQKSPEVSHIHKSHDVVISSLKSQESIRFQESLPKELLTCEERLRAVTCFSEKTEGGYDPECSKEKVSEELLLQLFEATKELPELAEKIFCHLDRLQIQPGIFSIGYASPIQDENRKTIGNLVGIRADVLSKNSTHDIWTWKEQLSFGLSKTNDPNYAFSPLGPKIENDFPEFQYPLFVGVMTHEAAHLLDFMNSANDVEYEFDNQGNKSPFTISLKHKDSSFGKLSWPNYTFMSDGSQWPPEELKKAFPLLIKLCYYRCETTTDPSLIPDVYGSLKTTSFVTSYASSSEMEDFAETFTYMSLESQKVLYEIKGPDGSVLHSSEETLQSERFKEKRAWMNAFLARPDLKYKIIPENLNLKQPSF